eukprot:gene20725-biopygen2598
MAPQLQACGNPAPRVVLVPRVLALKNRMNIPVGFLNPSRCNPQQVMSKRALMGGQRCILVLGAGGRNPESSGNTRRLRRLRNRRRWTEHDGCVRR